MTYKEFLQSKQWSDPPTGFPIPDGSINPALFDFQRAMVRWFIHRGRAGCFADCGLGKTFMELEWSDHVAGETGKPVITFAPLAVSQQTNREGEKFGFSVKICGTQDDVLPGLDITNYEKLRLFPDPSQFGGVVLDESSILKGFDGKTRKALTEWASKIPYRLACTATPAPNDYMELGNHAEFLGVMTATEMLATFFVHDGGDTSKWRLKRHAEGPFWKWVASWAVAIRKPSDLGFDNKGFVLPELRMHQLTVECDIAPAGYLFPIEARTLQERAAARKVSTNDRVTKCAELVAGSNDPWIIWCNLNAEGDALEKSIPGAVQVSGADSTSVKESAMLGFASGEIRVLISKPSICGFGMNWQHCHNVAFVGLSDSYEQFYQAIRRCWRFGQTKPVDCYVITAETEGAVVQNIQRKEKQAVEMMENMVEHMKDEMKKSVCGLERETHDYEIETQSSERWTSMLGDSTDRIKEIPDASVGYSVFSPPFASLYTYTNSDRDMGNCKDYAEFAQHFRFLVPELFRILKPGRLVSFHCMNLPISKEREGFIGIRDFRGELIRLFIENGFIYHSEVCIWKDPVTAMHRTKALGLLYKQLKKDSAMSRQGIPDYLVTMRKPGPNPDPVKKDPDEFPVSLWQRFASPVWPDNGDMALDDGAYLDADKLAMAEFFPHAVWRDVNPSNTLQHRSARGEDDERHICPLQLEVIERGIRLWTNPNDVVFSPFMGIGSEGYVALRLGRRFTGIELKRSYYEQSVKNLKFSEKASTVQLSLLDQETEESEVKA